MLLLSSVGLCKFIFFFSSGLFGPFSYIPSVSLVGITFYGFFYKKKMQLFLFLFLVIIVYFEATIILIKQRKVKFSSYPAIGNNNWS